METTTRLHFYDRPGLSHNSDDAIREKEPHISHENGGYHEVWGPDITLVQAYSELLGEQLEDYNSKQKRKDRRMTVEEYIESIEADTRGFRKRKRVNGKLVPDMDAKKGKKPAYEFIVSVGDTTKARDKNGNVDYDEDGYSIRPYEVPEEVNEAACYAYFEHFEERNPNMKIARADYHADEGWMNQRGVWEWGTPHLHLAFIPYADGFKRGPSRQNSMNKALSAMGYTGPQAYEKWWAAEREALEQYTQEAYAAYCREHPDFEQERGPLEIVHPIADGERPGENIITEQYRVIQDLEAELDDLDMDCTNWADQRAWLIDEVKTLTERKERLEGYITLVDDVLADLDAPGGAIETVLGNYDWTDGKVFKRYYKALEEPPRGISEDVAKQDVEFLKSFRLRRKTGEVVNAYDALLADRERRKREFEEKQEQERQQREQDAAKAKETIQNIRSQFAPYVPTDDAERERISRKYSRYCEEERRKKDADEFEL